MNARIDILPVFKPNEYLLKTHRDKGKDDWEIYAWAVRDIMARHGGFEKCEMPIRDKLVYKDFMSGKTDEFSYKDMHFSAEPLYAKKAKKE